MTEQKADTLQHLAAWASEMYWVSEAESFFLCGYGKYGDVLASTEREGRDVDLGAQLASLVAYPLSLFYLSFTALRWHATTGEPIATTTAWDMMDGRGALVTCTADGNFRLDSGNDGAPEMRPIYDAAHKWDVVMAANGMDETASMARAREILRNQIQEQTSVQVMDPGILYEHAMIRDYVTRELSTGRPDYN